MKEFKDWLKNIDVLYYATGFSIIVAFLAIVHTVLYREIPEANKEQFAHLIGIVEGSFVTGLVGYFFVKSKDNTTPTP